MDVVLQREQSLDVRSCSPLLFRKTLHAAVAVRPANHGFQSEEAAAKRGGKDWAKTTLVLIVAPSLVSVA